MYYFIDAPRARRGAARHFGVATSGESQGAKSFWVDDISLPAIAILPSNRNPFDLIECDLIARPIVELGGARAFMRGHHLRIL